MDGLTLDRARHLAHGAVRGFIAEALVVPTGLITVAFLTRRLGPQAYGLFTLAAAVVAWIEWSINAVFSRATIKLISDAEDWRSVGSAIMRLQLAASGAATVLLWLMAGHVATVFAEPALATYLRLFVLDIPLFNLARVHRQILIGIGDFQRQALASAGRWIAKLVLFVLLVELGLSVEGAILGSIGASIVELAIGRVHVRSSFSDRAMPPPRRVWGYAAPLPPLALVGHLLLNPRLGPIGAALVTTVTAGLGALGAVVAVYRLWHLLPPVGTLYRSLLVSGGRRRPRGRLGGSRAHPGREAVPCRLRNRAVVPGPGRVHATRERPDAHIGSCPP